MPEGSKSGGKKEEIFLTFSELDASNHGTLIQKRSNKERKFDLTYNGNGYCYITDPYSKNERCFTIGNYSNKLNLIGKVSGGICEPHLHVTYGSLQSLAIKEAEDNYKRGRQYSMEREYHLAFEWYKKAAIEGHPKGQFQTGVMYSKGQGITQDFKEAHKWLQLSAKQGLSLAQYHLGEMYSKGQGVTQDFKEAHKWFLLAAKKSYSGAQYQLGLMYEKGNGVEKNSSKAFKWHKKAAKQGHRLAKVYVDQHKYDIDWSNASPYFQKGYESPEFMEKIYQGKIDQFKVKARSSLEKAVKIIKVKTGIKYAFTIYHNIFSELCAKSSVEPLVEYSIRWDSENSVGGIFVGREEGVTYKFLIRKRFFPSYEKAQLGKSSTDSGGSIGKDTKKLLTEHGCKGMVVRQYETNLERALLN